MADIPDADLPVFPFKVNWKSGISERLEWKTDILGDLVGNEQRRGLRLHPRREFEVTLTLWDGERSFLDLWLHRMVGAEFLFPIWHDSVRAAQAAPQGQKTIWVDTEGLEFRIGSYGLLRGLTAMQFERFQIAEVHADRIVAVDDLVADWPKGTRVEPLVRGQMSDQTRTTLASSRASETQALFETTRAQEYDEGVDPFDQYLGIPVLTTQPNRSDQLDVQHIWSFYDSDSQTGRRYRKSEEGRAKTSQKHSWFLHGRLAKAEFRQFLYRMKGALGPVWLPTFNDDMTVAQDAGVGATTLYINEIGFAYTGGPTSGREYIAIQTTTGWLYRRVLGTAAAPAGQERLVLNAPFPTGLQRKNIRRVCWMDTARLENDRIEFNHINAADGLSTVSSIFKAFRNDRIAPTILESPIPEGVMLPYPCGFGITTVVIDLPLNPMPPVYDEYGVWFGNVRVNVTTLNYGGFSCQVSTVPRAAEMGYDEWTIVGVPERVRYRYESEYNRITLLIGDAITDLGYYSIGNRTLAPWPGTAESLFPTVFVNGVEKEIRSIVTTNIWQLTDSATAYGTVNQFPVLDIDMRYWTT